MENLLNKIEIQYEDKLKDKIEPCLDVYTELYEWHLNSDTVDRYDFVSMKDDSGKIPLFLHDWIVLDGKYKGSSIYSHFKDGKIYFTSTFSSLYKIQFETYKTVSADKEFYVCVDGRLRERVDSTSDIQTHGITCDLKEGFHYISFEEDEYENNEILYRSFSICK